MLPASLAEARKAQIAPAKALHASDLRGALGFASLHQDYGWAWRGAWILPRRACLARQAG